MSDSSHTTFLYQISSLPLDAEAEIFRQYPAFKLGVTAAVSHYARLLLPLVTNLIANDSQHKRWAFTSPAITGQTPAAANLLCSELFELCSRDSEIRASKEVSLIEIEYDLGSSISADWKVPNRSYDYAKLDFADRVTERERLSNRLVHKTDVQGCAVIFVNDIRVSGAQQQTMQRYFERVEAACVEWLYVIVVDPEIGKTNSRLEWEINFAPFEDLLHMVSREEIQFTGKCVQRLLHLSIAELEQILNALDRERRSRLLQLAIRNGFENAEDVEQQMHMLKAYTQ